MVALLYHDIYLHDPSESGFTGAVADRYKLDRDEFTATLDAVEQAGTSVGAVAPDGFEPPDHDVLITVDDGGVSYAGHTADELERRQWRGHCFVSTDMIGKRGFVDRRQLRDLDQRGHVIGSHSATHPTRFSACDWPTMLREWQSSRQTLEDILGHAVRVGSLPGGYFSERVALSAWEAGLRVLFTSEPVRRVQHIAGCAVVGRFTIRPGVALDDLTAVAAGARFPMFRQWTAWTAKKLVKPILGPAYPRLGAFMPARRRSS